MKKQLFINGEWKTTDEYSSLYSPFSGELLAEVGYGSRADIDKAIEAAYEAREIMAEMPSHERASILENVANLLKEQREQAAILIAKEAAKPLKTARAEVDRTITTYKFAAEEAKRIYGETVPMDAAPGGEGRIAYTVNEPIGVVGAITPFNFPMNLVAHKIGPAIAAGNTVVLKPAGQTPLSSLLLAELFEKAGLPAGALNVVTGSGAVLGDLLVEDDRVKKISFTGSPEVGKRIRNKAGLKKVTLELGSNSAVIIDKDIDLEKVVSRCVSGAFSFQGQVCISLQRIYVHEQQYESFVSELVKATSKLKLGDPLDEATDVSALIHPKDVERALDWIEEAKQEGATVELGGKAEGNILHPTILTEVDSRLKVSCEEAFAPIVIVNKISSINEGINCVNDSSYGLQAGIYTNDIYTALDATQKLHVGGVMVNDIPTFRVDHMPYGGVKESGVGREGIRYAMKEMMEQKLVVFNKN